MGGAYVNPPTNCRWLIASNFNFVESRQNKMNASSRLVPLQERLVFGALKLFLNVDEPPRSIGSQRFSWDNYRTNGQRILAQVDLGISFGT